MKFIFISILIFFSAYGSGMVEQSATDSLLVKLNAEKSDTTKIHILISLCSEYVSSDLDKSILFGDSAIAGARKINFIHGLAASLNRTGYAYFYKGENDKALEYQAEALKLMRQLKNKKGIAKSLNYLGLIYNEKGDYPHALDNYIQSLKIKEEMGDTAGIAYSLHSIGVLYSEQEKYDKALECFYKSLKIFKDLNYKDDIANLMARLGNVYSSQLVNDTAMLYYKQSLKLFEETKNNRGIAILLNNIAGVYCAEKKYAEAVPMYLRALQTRETIGDKNGAAILLLNIGDTKRQLGNYKEALVYLKRGLEVSKQIGYKDIIKEIYKSMAKTYSHIKDFESAYKYHILFSDFKDSMFNEEGNRQITEMQTKYETEKKQKEIELLNKDKKVKELEIKERVAEVKKQRIMIYSFVAGFLLILVFSILLYRMYRAKKKANILLAFQNEEIKQQKEEISAQRDLILETNEELMQQKEEILAQRDEIERNHDLLEEKNREVMDSIYYARRIQNAILPTVEFCMTELGDHFILYLPKDIVSGDFYFIAKRRQWLLIAVADCTGHGVPGAFMSMLGISFLNEIIAREDIATAADALNELRKDIIKSLQQRGVSGEQKDGMDIALCAINTGICRDVSRLADVSTYTLQYAGANNPLYIVKNVSPLGEVKHLEEWKGDKMPVAIYEKMNSFTNHEIQINKGDSIYLFSDGFPDQFGGPRGKKFMYRRFKQVLTENCEQPMTLQKTIFNKTFIDWKGNLEQVDDITLLGFKM